MVKKVKAPKVKGKYNKKILVVFLACISTVFLSGFVVAAIDVLPTPGTIGMLTTPYDRIRYWRDGILSDIDAQIDYNARTGNGDTTPVRYYEAIPQEYALGYLSYGYTGIKRRYYSSPVPTNGMVPPSANDATSMTMTQYNGGRLMLCTPNGKSYLTFYDAENGATYMGNLYDVREYYWAVGLDTETKNNSPIERVTPRPGIIMGVSGVGGYNNCYHELAREDNYYDQWGQTALAREFHFYPQGTLSNYWDLVFTKTSNPNDAYKDDNNNIIYTGRYTGSLKSGEQVNWSAQEYEDELKKAEESLTLPNSSSKGVFQGIVRFGDIDSWDIERYTPVRGVKYVFKNWNSAEYAMKEAEGIENLKKLGALKLSEERVGRSLLDENDWYKRICKGDNSICKYSWGSRYESATSNMTTQLWFNFTSSYDSPFTLIYSGIGHGSGLGSSDKTIVYVIKDDAADVPEDILDEIEKFSVQYEKIYGTPLRDNAFLKSNNIDASQVLRLFNIFEFSEYDPYEIQNLGLSEGIPDEWYSCAAVNDDCKVEKGTKDFITDSRVYYGYVTSKKEVDFDNTCYSNNTSTVEGDGYAE